MSPFLIAAVGVVYLYIAIEQFVLGHPATAITFFGYAFANVGLYLLARG